MRIVEINTTPLMIPYSKPFHWAQGVISAAEVVLIEIRTDDGVIGYAVESLIAEASKVCIGGKITERNKLISQSYKKLFAAQGTCSAPRFGAQILAGLDMALWDAFGKTVGCPVHELLGGAVRDEIEYFGFPQGESPDELATEAKEWAKHGSKVIYIKIGRGEDIDLNIAKSVRSVIPKKRLRFDANEAWDVQASLRMIRKLMEFNIEVIEQPTDSKSLAALKHVKETSPIAIAADQVIFTPEDVFEVCRNQAADLIVLGLHEAGGVSQFCKAAAIAETAGLNICIHGIYETGITTCASNQVAATLKNLDDGNQYMNHFLEEDIILEPNLKLIQGRLPVLSGPGFGFEINEDAVARANKRYKKSMAGLG